MTSHDHPPVGECLPTCPGWSEGALELYALQRRHGAMLAACRAADRIEFLIVAPATAGAELPEFLHEQELVRLNTVVGRDCPEVLLDEWGLRLTLTFRGRRHDCALPWGAVMAGALVAPARKRPRFGVVTGGAGGGIPPSDGTASSGDAHPDSAPPAPRSGRTSTPTPPSSTAPTPSPAPTSMPAEPEPSPPRPRVAFGVILGGKSDQKD